MEPHRPERPIKQVDLTALGFVAWPLFLITLGLTMFWLLFGARLVGYYYPIGDLVFVSVLGFATTLVVLSHVPVPASRLVSRRAVALTLFLGALTFALLRPFVGLEDVTTIRLFTTVEDEGTGQPVEGVRLTARDGPTMLADAVTDARGRTVLKYEVKSRIVYSWLVSRMTFQPDRVTVEARIGSLPPQSRLLERPARYRWRFGDDYDQHHSPVFEGVRFEVATRK